MLIYVKFKSVFYEPNKKSTMTLIARMLYLFLLLIMFSSCSSSQCTDKKVSQKSELNKIAKDIIDNEFDIVNNKTNEYALCIENSDMDNSKKFFVYEYATGAVVHKGNYIMGNVTWSSDYEINLTIHPGIISKEDTGKKPGYYFNVITKTKVNH